MRFRVPRWGSTPYELLDNSVFLLILATVGYLLTDPPNTNRDALAFVYDVLPPTVWGAGLSGVAVFAAACACDVSERWVRRGMVTLQAACVFWATCFAVGASLYAIVYSPDNSIIRVAISVVLYLWIASRIQRDLQRWDMELALRESKQT